MNFKKLTLLPILLILNACRAEPNFVAQSEHTLPQITRATQSPFSGNTEMAHQKIAKHIILLPDSRPIAFGNNILLLGAPDSDTYPHGVLGDAIEAKTLKPTAAAFRLPEISGWGEIL